MTGTAYREFLEAKVASAKSYGFEVDADQLSSGLKPHCVPLTQALQTAFAQAGVVVERADVIGGNVKRWEEVPAVAMLVGL